MNANYLKICRSCRQSLTHEDWRLQICHNCGCRTPYQKEIAGSVGGMKIWKLKSGGIEFEDIASDFSHILSQNDKASLIELLSKI